MFACMYKINIVEKMLDSFTKIHEKTPYDEQNQDDLYYRNVYKNLTL